jgi:signal transduction histidine kinase
VKRWWRSHSVRVRLTLWYVVTMAMVLGVYILAVFLFVRQNLLHALDDQLRTDFQWAAATLDYTDEGGFEWTEPEIVADYDPPWVQVWTADGTQLVVTSGEARRRPLPDSQSLAMQADDRVAVVAAGEVRYRVLTRRGDILRPTRVPVVIQVARPEAPALERLRDLSVLFGFALPIAMALAGFGGYAVAKRALSPVERMTDRARSITADRLGDRLPVHNPEDEMGRLATVFNETLARLQASFDQMRHFTADVSHELRTPLTAIRSVGEVGLRGHRDEPAYRGIIGSMLEEADRLASLVDRLLTLSRAETHQSPHSNDVVDLEDLAGNVTAHLGVLSEEKGQTLQVRCRERSFALGDRIVLRQALINLVDNAIKFTPPGGAVTLEVSSTPNEAIVDVLDGGPGIPPAARTRIFDRFYRDEHATAAGTGLGLSIAKGAVEASGGRLTLEATGPRGSTFRIAMPRDRSDARRRAG